MTLEKSKLGESFTLADWARNEAIKNAPVSDAIARFLLANGETKEGSTWHEKRLRLKDGRDVYIGMASVNRLKTLEEIRANRNQNDTLKISVPSPREGVVGYNIWERMYDNHVAGFRLHTGPDSWLELIGVFAQDAGGIPGIQAQILKDYGKLLLAVAKGLNVPGYSQEKVSGK